MSDPQLLGRTLREFRATHRMSQADLAQILNVDQTSMSRIEAGTRHVRDLDTLLQVARQLDLRPEQLGVATEVVDPVDPVAVSQERWRATRRYLKQNNGTAVRAAAHLYRPQLRMGGDTTLTRPEWIPARPVARLLGDGLMGSSGASILARAWTFRDELLSRS